MVGDEGQEGELVLDQMYAFADAPHRGPLRAPRAAFIKALWNATHPEEAIRQAAERAKSEPSAARSHKTQDFRRVAAVSGAEVATSRQSAEPKDESDDARWERLKVRAAAVGRRFKPERPADMTLDDIEKYGCLYGAQGSGGGRVKSL